MNQNPMLTEALHCIQEPYEINMNIILKSNEQGKAVNMKCNTTNRDKQNRPQYTTSDIATIIDAIYFYFVEDDGMINEEFRGEFKNQMDQILLLFLKRRNIV